MNYKILFCIVPTYSWDKFTNPNEYDTYDLTSTGKKTRIFVGGIPIGILSIASYIKKYNKNVDIKIVDFNLIISKLVQNGDIDKYESFNQIYHDTIKNYIDFRPDVIALSSIFNSSYISIKECAYIMKKFFNNSIIILGGALATNAYENILNSIPEIYATCVGEGERPLAELFSENNILLELEKNVSFVTREKLSSLFKMDVKPKFVENLDDVPYFDYNLINFYDYSDSNFTYGNIITDKSYTRVLNVCSTRGCPHKCTFCCSHSVHGRKVRYHSAYRIIKDIEYAVDNFGVNTITFNDDNFLMNKQRALEILGYLKDKNLNVTFPNGFTIYAIDEEIAYALRDGGVKEAALALESGNQDTLTRIVKKPLKLEMVKPAIDYLRKANIYVRGFFMIGFPGETKESIEISIDYMSKLDFNWVMIYTVTPFLGSEIYEICKSNNYLTVDNMELIFCKPIISTPDFEPEYIQERAYLANLQVNFINNFDMKHGNYDIALMRFEKIIKQAEDHAIAYYCASLCCRKLGYEEKEMEYIKKAKIIIEKSSLWKKYCQNLGIEFVCY